MAIISQSSIDPCPMCDLEVKSVDELKNHNLTNHSSKVKTEN